MPLPVAIRLPREKVPLFPNRCVACMQPHPGDRLVARARAFSLHESWMPWLWFARKPVQRVAPACPACRSAAVWRGRHRILMFLVAALLAFTVLDPLLGKLGLPRAVKRFTLPIAAVAALMPLFVWLTFRPPVFDITVGADHVDHEFRNRDYAIEFAVVNGATKDQIR